MNAVGFSHSARSPLSEKLLEVLQGEGRKGREVEFGLSNTCCKWGCSKSEISSLCWRWFTPFNCLTCRICFINPILKLTIFHILMKRIYCDCHMPKMCLINLWVIDLESVPLKRTNVIFHAIKDVSTYTKYCFTNGVVKDFKIKEGVMTIHRRRKGVSKRHNLLWNIILSCDPQLRCLLLLEICCVLQ